MYPDQITAPWGAVVYGCLVQPKEGRNGAGIFGKTFSATFLLPLHMSHLWQLLAFFQTLEPFGMVFWGSGIGVSGGAFSYIVSGAAWSCDYKLFCGKTPFADCPHMCCPDVHCGSQKGPHPLFYGQPCQQSRSWQPLPRCVLAAVIDLIKIRCLKGNKEEQ